MVSRNDVQPSHILFADDIFLFCNGDKRNIRKLLNFLKDYQISSGQRINFEKSKCFIGGTSELRKYQLENECNMPLSTFPDKYLSVLLTPGCIKSSHVWGCVEQIQENLAGKKVIQDVERIIRNFLWTGDPSTRKCVTLKWDYVCAPMEEGLKWVKEDIQDHSRRLVGDGSKISAWRDSWVKDRALKDIFSTNEYMHIFPDMKVSDLLLDGEWVLPAEVLEMVQQNELPVVSTNEDKKIWCGLITGEFTFTSAVEWFWAFGTGKSFITGKFFFTKLIDTQ
ncbi:uncharacterized protein LOC113338619 [Papaver somniferum]|uniref:uncharacterized protein LOC113338619 n=1 Tax=Papaver somniferum TaxID=3469 RepID=UPI000E705E0F|nr:uncharacterized protein LOC113338619 [Papaver somniferum]